MPARPKPLIGGPRLSAPARAPLLSLSPSHCSVGPACQRQFPRARAHPLSLPRGPHQSDPIPTLPPTAPPWTWPRLRTPQPPPHALTPLDPMPRSPTSPCSFVPSAEQSRPACEPKQLCCYSPTSVVRSTVVVGLPAASIAPVSSALSLATWNAPRFTPSPSGPPGPCSPEFFLCSRSSATVALMRP